MKPIFSLILFLLLVFTFGQVSLNPGDKITSGKIILSNGETVQFYRLEYGNNEKVSYINAQNLQSEFLYISSVKSIETDENSTLSQSQIRDIENALNPQGYDSENQEIAYSIFEIKDEKIELQNPKKGKAAVYFVRTETSAFLINFRHFHYDKFIGKFAGMGYIRYECDPGEQIFWASSQNAIFMKAYLEPDKIYVIEEIPAMSFGYAQVKLGMPKKYDEKYFAKFRKRVLRVLSDKNLDKTPTQQELDTTQSEYAKEVENGLRKSEKRFEKDEYYNLFADQYFE